MICNTSVGADALIGPYKSGAVIRQIPICCVKPVCALSHILYLVSYISKKRPDIPYMRKIRAIFVVK